MLLLCMVVLKINISFGSLVIPKGPGLVILHIEILLMTIGPNHVVGPSAYSANGWRC